MTDLSGQFITGLNVLPGFINQRPDLFCRIRAALCQMANFCCDNRNPPPLLSASGEKTSDLKGNGEPGIILQVRSLDGRGKNQQHRVLLVQISGCRSLV